MFFESDVFWTTREATMAYTFILNVISVGDIKLSVKKIPSPSQTRRLEYIVVFVQLLPNTSKATLSRNYVRETM